MRWPPNKAWTSKLAIKGYRHFVAINYGGKSQERWISLVAVLDGNAKIRVLWEELKDSSIWESGWAQLPKDEAMSCDENYEFKLKAKDLSESVCLHPSEDSGLRVPIETSKVRPWFDL